MTLPPSLPGVPAYNGTYFGSVTIGGAGVRAFATPADEFAVPPIDLPGEPDPVLPPAVPAGTVRSSPLSPTRARGARARPNAGACPARTPPRSSAST